MHAQGGLVGKHRINIATVAVRKKLTVSLSLES